MMTLAERIERDGITAAYCSTGMPGWHVGEWTHGSHSYQVTLTHREGRQTTQPLTLGPGLDYPNEREVIILLFSSMLHDAAAFADARGFEEWAGEAGLDLDDEDDEQRARATYARVEQQNEELREFLGDAYEAYLRETESA